MLDPASGALKQVRPSERSIEWYAIGGDAAWSGALDPSDPHPPAAKFPADELLRLDLASGAVSTWFTLPGSQVGVVGFDPGGLPLIESSTPQATTLWLASGPANRRELAIWTGSGTHVISSVASSGRTWLTTDSGLYVYTQDAGLTEIAAPGVVNGNVDVAGDCVASR